MKVHIILNSHLDPVWLWHRSQGTDAVLATARTACDLLDEFPEIRITRGEAWFYETVEKLDPVLFRRIAANVASSRWHVVGGTYVQSDCNLIPPSVLRRQLDWAKRYFADRFGVRVETGYNVDSFGHAATLPDFYAAAGIQNYCFMRPAPHEKTLPGSLFYWESPSGNRLLTFRIARSYCTNRSCVKADLAANLEACLESADFRCGHTMFFVGVGDHGGGPIREELRFLDQLRSEHPDIEFSFSDPDSFFREVRSSGAELPVVRDELQHHAIGCYSAVSRIKRGMRESAALLEAVDLAIVHRKITLAPAEKQELENAWKELFFVSFHDLLAGSCIASASEEACHQLAAAGNTAQKIMESIVRLPNAALAPYPAQRLILDNFGTDFDDVVEVEPWMGPWMEPECRKNEFQLKDDLGDLRDEEGRSIPFQRLEPEAASGSLLRLLFRLKIASGERKILSFHLSPSPEIPAAAHPARLEEEALGNGLIGAKFSPHGFFTIDRSGQNWTTPLEIAVIPDNSDTWSHGLFTYSAPAEEYFRTCSPWITGENGPLLAEKVNHFTCHCGKLHCRLRSYSDLPVLEMRLDLVWYGTQKIVKLCFRPEFPVASRRDGIIGGTLKRLVDGKEYPLRSWSMLSSSDGRTVAVISPETTSIDVQPDGTVRLTLLRSPYYAHHAPYLPEEPHWFPVTEQGELHYNIRFLLLDSPDVNKVEETVSALEKQIYLSESTFGIVPTGEK